MCHGKQINYAVGYFGIVNGIDLSSARMWKERIRGG